MANEIFKNNQIIINPDFRKFLIPKYNIKVSLYLKFSATQTVNTDF